MRPAWFLLLAAIPMAGQVCAPTPLAAGGAVSGKLDDSNCLLSDATAYAAYRVDLPVRGRLQAELSGTSADLILTLRDASGAKVEAGPLEAGSYTLLVNGRTPGQVGGYTVLTRFTATPGVLCDGFPLLGTDQSVDGVLGGSGCTLPDGTPYEAYRLPSSAEGTLTITAAGASFDAELLLRDEAGWLVASGTGSLTAAVDRDREYRVVIHGGGKTGAYRLTTAFEASEDETCRPRDLGPSVENHAIDADSCSADQTFYDGYRITIGEPGVASFRVSTQDFQPRLTLLDAAGNLRADEIAAIRIQLAPATYRLQVASAVTPGGNYQLAYEFLAGQPQPCERGTLSFDEPAVGTLSAANCRTALGPGAIYSITIAEAGRIAIDAANGPATLRLALADTKENLLAATDAGASHIEAMLPFQHIGILSLEFHVDKLSRPLL